MKKRSVFGILLAGAFFLSGCTTTLKQPLFSDSAFIDGYEKVELGKVIEKLQKEGGGYPLINPSMRFISEVEIELPVQYGEKIDYQSVWVIADGKRYGCALPSQARNQAAPVLQQLSRENFSLKRKTYIKYIVIEPLVIEDRSSSDRLFSNDALLIEDVDIEGLKEAFAAKLAEKEAEEKKAGIAEDLFVVEQNKQGKIIIKGFTGKQQYINIPDKISGIEVSEIGENAFMVKNAGKWLIKSVVLPKYLVKIGKGAFRSWDIPLVRNGLTEIIIPDAVTTIEDEAFLNNNIAKLIIPNSVTSIGDMAFGGNRLTEITIPDSVASIGWRAFSHNTLTEITIPNSVTSIGNMAFDENPLKKVSFGNRLKAIPLTAFKNFDGITEITIGSDVEFGNYSDLGNLALLFGEAARKSEFQKVTDGPFINYYISQGRKAGTYVLNGQIWTRKN